MTEAERLQKIVTAQEKEIKRLRAAMQVARVATVDIDSKVEDDHWNVYIVCTAIGVDEFHFIEQVKGRIGDLIEQVHKGSKKALDAATIKDEKGDPMIGGVSP